MTQELQRKIRTPKRAEVITLPAEERAKCPRCKKLAAASRDEESVTTFCINCGYSIRRKTK